MPGDVLTATVTALAGLAVGLCAVGALMLARGHRPGRTPAPEPAPGPVPQGYRYCPAEQRTRAAVLHPDGTAHCGDCGVLIPAGDS